MGSTPPDTQPVRGTPRLPARVPGLVAPATPPASPPTRPVPARRDIRRGWRPSRARACWRSSFLRAAAAAAEAAALDGGRDCTGCWMAEGWVDGGDGGDGGCSPRSAATAAARHGQLRRRLLATVSCDGGLALF